MKKRYIFTLLLAGISYMLSAQTVEPENEALLNYQEFCANCHGPNFQGGNAQSLVDGNLETRGVTCFEILNLAFHTWGCLHMLLPFLMIKSTLW